MQQVSVLKEDTGGIDRKNVQTILDKPKFGYQYKKLKERLQI